MLPLYSYVGPPEIANGAANATTPRAIIDSFEDIRRWVVDSKQALDGAKSFTATFIIDANGQLWIADRHSEHVACARGEQVLSAGEITFSVNAQEVELIYVTNQSTGYCPQPSSWPCVADALDRAGIARPDEFDVQCVFRRCTCGQINIVKNGDYSCGVCGSVLSRKWNLSDGLTPS